MSARTTVASLPLTEAYRKLNPTAKVPTLIDGEHVIRESHTILRYLAAMHGPTLTGATPAERTMVERWMDWLNDGEQFALCGGICGNLSASFMKY